MPNRQKYPVVAIEHGDGEIVYCWGVESGAKAIRSCLTVHPEEEISVSTIKMTEKQFDAMEDYTGEC
jgi:CRISPR/Cas system-associated protein endoribonuclease Cas2